MVRCLRKQTSSHSHELTQKQYIGYGVASIDVVDVKHDDINRSAMHDRDSRSFPRPGAAIASNTLTLICMRIVIVHFLSLTYTAAKWLEQTVLSYWFIECPHATFGLTADCRDEVDRLGPTESAAVRSAPRACSRPVG
jgi:hypothetical protein